MSKNKGLLDVSAIMSGKTVKVKEIEKKSSYYPTLRLHHAIQTDLDNPNYMHLHGIADKPIKLEGGYSLCVIAAKNAARFLDADEKGEKFYNKIYWQEGEDPKAVKDMSEKDANKNTGRTYLLVIFYGDTTVLAEFDTFGIYNDYWKSVGSTGMVDKNVMTVNIDNHRDNMVKAKSGFNYHSPKLFKQFKLEQLSEVQLEIISDLVKENIAGINDWINATDNKMKENEEEEEK